MTFTMTFNDGDFLEHIENIKRDESLCLITNKEKAFISKEKLEEKDFENYHFFELENSETCNKEFLDLIKTIFRTPCFTIVIDYSYTSNSLCCIDCSCFYRGPKLQPVKF